MTPKKKPNFNLTKLYFEFQCSRVNTKNEETQACNEGVWYINFI